MNIIFEIDKAAFGKFVAEQRKGKGYTQKELAAKLFVSDKAVSKWERGLSMPDISLLMPLAELLEVSVTELLEGRKLNPAYELDVAQVEVLVKKALTLSEDSPERKKERLRKHALLFGSGTSLAALELLVSIWYLPKIRIGALSTNLLVLEGLSFCFGIYFWFFIKTNLPAYFDEYKISAYSDGPFRINIPGVNFNNKNWPHLVKFLRMWSLITMATAPLVFFLLLALVRDPQWSFKLENVVLLLYLAGMVVPLYIIGKKYE